MTEKLKEFDKFYEKSKEIDFLEFEELISNAKTEEKKLFFNTLLQFYMGRRFKEVLDQECYE